MIDHRSARNYRLICIDEVLILTKQLSEQQPFVLSCFGFLQNIISDKTQIRYMFVCVRVCMGSCKCWFEPCCPCLFNI